MNNIKPEINQTVVASPAMQAPGLKKMFEKRNYPALKIPPAGHARLSGEPERQTYRLTYAGYDIVTFLVKGDVPPKLRFHSDGDFQSYPFVQQFVISAPQKVEADIAFRFPVETVNMRPRRARDGEAILGQVGYPLLSGVNGLYALDWDLLVSFHGKAFDWHTDEIKRTEEDYQACLSLMLDERPLVLLVRPRFYSEHLGYKTHEPWIWRPNAKPVAGWCSWEAYHSEVTQAHIEDAAKTLSPLVPYGLEYMQLDDGYQQSVIPPAPDQTVGDGWIHTNEKFSGHEAIVEAMRAGGFLPGIWTNAVVTNAEAAENGGYCLLDTEGHPLKGDWIQYVLDCTDDTLARHVTPYYRKLREYGYEYFKSDALRHLIFDGLQEAVRLGLMDEETAFARQRAYMCAAREGIGYDAYYLSCWGVLTQSIGVSDACRVATDANPNWYAVSMQLRETARWFFAQRVLFTLDPDHVCVRAEYAWVRMLLSLVSLTGGLYMISDKPETYDESRLELIRRTLPPLAARTAETGPLDYTTPACYGVRQSNDWDQTARDIAHIDIDNDKAPFGSLWATHFALPGRRWCVVQRAAVVPLAACSIALERLALLNGRVYYAYDFWAQKPLGCVTDFLHFDRLPLGETTVIGLTDVSDGLPHLVGGDRHVSMDAVSVTKFDSGANYVHMALKGFAGLTCRYALYGAEHLRNMHCSGGTASIEASGDLSVLTVCFDAEMMTVEIS